MSNIMKAREAGMMYCSVAGNAREWRNFTLQKGHVWGYSPELEHEDLPIYEKHDGFFVVYREMRNSIILYTSMSVHGARHEWQRYAIEKTSSTGQVILDVLHQRRGAVTFTAWKHDPIEKVYNPPIGGMRVLPVEGMYIPQGARHHGPIRVSHARGTVIVR